MYFCDPAPQHFIYLHVHSRCLLHAGKSFICMYILDVFCMLVRKDFKANTYTGKQI